MRNNANLLAVIHGRPVKEKEINLLARLYYRLGVRNITKRAHLLQ
jgi:hypothetical protein